MGFPSKMRAIIAGTIASVILVATPELVNAAPTLGASGQYYHVAAGSTGFSITDVLNDVTPGNLTGTFTSTALSYAGDDNSTLSSFLGADAGSYVGIGTQPAAPLSDGIFVISGRLYVNAGSNSFSVTHDDAAQLIVGGQTIFSGGFGLGSCCGTYSTSASFGGAGWVPFQLVYANTQYNGGTGQAYITVDENGAVANGVSAVPEPTVWAMMLVGFGMIGFTLRSRRSNKLTSSNA